MAKKSSTTIPDTPVRFILHVTRKFKWLAIGGSLAVVLAKVAEFAAIFSISQLVDNFTAVSDTEQQLEVLFFWGAVFVVLGVLDRIGWRLSGFAGIAWAIKANEEAYKDLYRYVTRHSHDYFTNRFAGSISNKISNAANSASDMIMRFLWDILPRLLSILVTLWFLFAIHWSLGVIFFSVFAFVFAFNLFWVKRRRPLVVEYSAASSLYRGKGVDLITNVGAMRQYVRRVFEMKHLDQTLTSKVKKDFRQSYHGEWLMVANGVFGVLLMVGILVGVYIMLQQGLATAGQLVLVLLLLAEMGYTFNIMGQLMNGFVRRYGEIEEGLEEVVIPHEIIDAPGAKKLKATAGEIKWNAVDFSFGPVPVFEQFDLTIEPGQRIGLVGHSGAGKTTFVSLLLRQHELNAGAITIDGQDIAQVTQESLRQNITIVPQEPMLFHRTIKENIMYGKPGATKKEVIAAAKKAQAHDFIERLPEGYDTLVGERGVKLSGGQKQRVAIARAMLKDAPILILDEATSALDSESEVMIQQALETLMEGKTVIAVAHRLSTLREMDRIIVLEDGEVIEDGSHKELSKASGTYQKLWEHQAGGFITE